MINVFSEKLVAIFKGFIGLFASCISVFSFADTDVTVEQLPTYANQAAWQQIDGFLPAKYQLTQKNLPTEEWWSWQGHNIHLDTYRNPNAKVKVILFHGVGTNGRQMSMILGEPLAAHGYETITIDMPGYGLTQVKQSEKVKYDDWVQAGNDLIEVERQKDNRPIMLYGLSAGGMLTYHVAAKNKHVKGIVGMTFLDTSNPQVRNEVSINKFIGRVGSPINHLTAKTPLASIRLPMRWVSKMHKLVNNDEALDVFLKDRTSAGNAVSI